MTDIYDGYKYKDVLLPCPFCGGDGESPYMSFRKEKHISDKFFTVMCGNCGAEPVHYCSTEEEAISAWNTRFKLQDSDAALTAVVYAKNKIIETIMAIDWHMESKA